MTRRTIRIACAGQIVERRISPKNVFCGSPTSFLNWLAMGLNAERPAFERTAIAKKNQGGAGVFGVTKWA